MEFNNFFIYFIFLACRFIFLIIIVIYIVLINSDLLQILGIVVFALCIWLKSDQSFHRWVEDLEIFEFYIGIYIILFGSCMIIFTSCLSCLFIANENVRGLQIVSLDNLFRAFGFYYFDQFKRREEEICKKSSK